MAQRTRNHLIEDESRQKFKQALPKYWICRDKHEDYGIDCEVEIFDEQGNSTGLVFWVQLKGTDYKKDAKIKKLYFTKEKIAQFLQYDIPVLLIRYATYNQKMYARWVSSLDWSDSEGKLAPVFFSESTLWSDNSASSIVSYLKNQITIKEGRVYLPVSVTVEKSLDYEAASIPFSNVLAIKTALSGITKYFSLRQDPSHAALSLRVAKDSILFSFTDITLARMKVSFDTLESSHEQGLKKHILVAFCSLLFDIGKRDEANQIVFDNDLMPIILKDEAFLLTILPHLLQSNYFAETMQVLQAHIRENLADSISVQLSLKILLMQNKQTLPITKLAVIETFLISELNFHISLNDQSLIGTAHYNLANHYKGQRQIRLAAEHFLSAGKNSIFYRNMHYYYADLAAMMFELGKFRFAANFYAKSVDLNSNKANVKALYADAIMYCGDYAVAKTKFDEYLNETKDAEDNQEWFLKYSILASLLANGYPESQKRNIQVADALVEKGDNDGAIEIDMLCESAWYNLSVEAAQAENYKGAFIGFTLSALLYRDQPDIWAQSLIYALNSNVHFSLILCIIIVAHFYTGQKFLVQLAKILKQNKVENIDLILELIDKTIPDERKQPLTVRILNGPDSYEEMTI